MIRFPCKLDVLSVELEITTKEFAQGYIQNIFDESEEIEIRLPFYRSFTFWNLSDGLRTEIIYLWIESESDLD